MRKGVKEILRKYGNFIKCISTSIYSKENDKENE